jgi:micrococcal nuclease
MAWTSKPRRSAVPRSGPSRKPKGPTPAWARPRRRHARRRRWWWPRRPLTLGAIVLLIPTLGPQLADLGAGLGVRAEGCRVLQVIDGDTVDMYCPGEGALRTRLMGFDAPEVFSPQCPAELRAGLEATWHLRRALWSAETLQVTLHGSDRYERALAEMRIDGRPVAEMMIAAGLARPYDGGTRRSWCV